MQLINISSFFYLVGMLAACGESNSDTSSSGGPAGAAGKGGMVSDSGTDTNTAGASGTDGNTGGTGGTGGMGGAGGTTPEPLDSWKEGLEPGVNWGIAKQYVDDIGIITDPYVLAAEDFETGTVTIATQQDRYANNVTVTNAERYTGQYAGVHTWPQGYEGPTTRYLLGDEAHQDERPAYFVRMVLKYDSSFHPENLDRAVGVKGFGIYFEDGSGNASTCEGMSWYNISCQFVGWGPSQKPEANDGFLWVSHLYSYNPYPQSAVPEVGTVKISDPPDGTQPCRFSSYAEPFDYIAFGSWRSYELGLYLNTPGQSDGEGRFWIDGVLQSRITNMRFRDLENQKPTSIHLNLHRTTANFTHTMVRWVDNIVLARRYIGPVKTSS